jgi:hypothetical protein
VVDALARVSTGIVEDVETFQQIMHQLGIGIYPVKIGLAVAAERLGRLKPNGRMSGYSPLSRFLELDVLAMGIDGKNCSGRPCVILPASDHACPTSTSTISSSGRGSNVPTLNRSVPAPEPMHSPRHLGKNIRNHQVTECPIRSAVPDRRAGIA